MLLLRSRLFASSLSASSCSNVMPYFFASVAVVVVLVLGRTRERKTEKCGGGGKKGKREEVEMKEDNKER